MFHFFLTCYRNGILSFCGSILKIKFKEDSSDGMFGFREYDNGRYKGQEVIYSKHPNILKGLITGKKSWGLWLNEWCDGIVEGSFTKDEILNQFTELNIIIPEKLMVDFENRLKQKKMKKWEQMVTEYLNRKNK